MMFGAVLALLALMPFFARGTPVQLSDANIDLYPAITKTDVNMRRQGQHWKCGRNTKMNVSGFALAAGGLAA